MQAQKRILVKGLEEEYGISWFIILNIIYLRIRKMMLFVNCWEGFCLY
jgi:hypothetical protein